jgi:hypothetical protein
MVQLIETRRLGKRAGGARWRGLVAGRAGRGGGAGPPIWARYTRQLQDNYRTITGQLTGQPTGQLLLLSKTRIPEKSNI